MTNSIDFLGRGWSFPPSFDKQGANMSEYSRDIKESLYILLSTNKGERVFRPNYGTVLKKWLFSSVNLTEKTLIIDELKDSIVLGEPRITVTSINITTKDELEGVLLISIDYTIRTTNVVDNLVFPFYQKL